MLLHIVIVIRRKSGFVFLCVRVDEYYCKVEKVRAFKRSSTLKTEFIKEVTKAFLLFAWAYH